MIRIMRCAICNNIIIGSYYTNEWGQAVCSSHSPVASCSSCNRFVKPTDRHLPDERWICAACQPSIVSQPWHIEWVDKKVRQILAAKGAVIPAAQIRMIPPAEMARLNGTNQINLFQPGLTYTQQTFNPLSSTQQHTIYVFDNLPKVQFAGILAHEMLHAWQNERRISLPAHLCEGFCNVGSYVVYQAIGNDLALHFIKRLEQDPNPVYGEGFRKVAAVYRRKGNLTETMNVLTQHTK